MVALALRHRSHALVTVVRRLDHVAIVVRSTAEALRFYEEHLGLRVHSSEEIEAPPVRLTYVDTGNAFLQLVEPLDETSSIAGWLSEHGEGLHHVCFGVDDVEQAVTSLSDPRRSCSGTARPRLELRPAAGSHGVRIECTEFRRDEDVEAQPGWLG